MEIQIEQITQDNGNFHVHFDFSDGESYMIVRLTPDQLAKLGQMIVNKQFVER